MDNKKTPPLVTIQSNIAEDTDAGNDSDTTVRFSPVTQQTSPTPTTHCEESIEPSQYFSPNEKNISSKNNETILHYSARHDNPKNCCLCL